MDFTIIIEAVISIVFIVVARFVIPWIKANYSNAQIANIQKWVQIGVRCAEMIFTEAGKGKEKYAYVENFLKENGITYDIVPIKELIEAEVLNIKKGLSE